MILDFLFIQRMDERIKQASIMQKSNQVQKEIQHSETPFI